MVAVVAKATKTVWRRASIKDVCESITDCVNKTAPTVDHPTPYKMIRTTNVKSGWIDLTQVKYVTKETFDRWTRRSIPRTGDVILTREAPLGEVGMVRHDDTIFLGQRLIQYRTNPDVLDNRFLLYAFQAEDLQAQIKALGSGATVEHMRVPDCERLTLLLPPLPVQRKIAAILSAYDDLIENNTRRIVILEAMAQAIYREWFVKFRFPGHESCRMVDSPLGLIPDGWRVAPIGEEIETLGGGTPSTTQSEFWEGGDIVWYSPTDLTSAGTMFISDSAKKITRAGLRTSSARLFPAYSVMMTSRATIGVVAINTKPSCTNQGFITLLPTQSLPAYFLYFWLLERRNEIVSLASGATFKEINRSTFRKLTLVIPDKETMQAFADAVAPVGKQIESLIARRNALRQTRDLLLPKLISGEVDVEGLNVNVEGERR